MNVYFVLYPRDFANEYTVYVVTPENLARFTAAFPGASRITRKEAVRLGHTRPREAKKTGEFWAGRFCETSLWQSAADAIAECEARTEEEIYWAECHTGAGA